MSKLPPFASALRLVALSVLLASCATPEVAKAPSAPLTVSLISFNDFHGNLLPSGLTVSVKDPLSGQPTKVQAGGVAYLATLIRDLRAQNPDNTLVVAAGDLISASPLVSGMFHDEPSVDALNGIGLAISTVGNHEFDKGRDELLRLQNGGCFPTSADRTRGLVGVDTCMNDGRFDGAHYRYLAANVIDEKTGDTLFPAYAVRTLGGVRIGFIGVTLKETPAVVTPKGVEGLRFADEVATINALVPELKRQGVAFIVVLMHQGAATTATTINDTSCPGFQGPALAIADRLDPAVEVVVSGHTHQEYVCRRPDGKLLTQAGHYGRLATKIDLTLDPASGKVLSKRASNYVVANAVLAKDTGLDAMVQRYAGLAAQRAAAVVAQLGAPLLRRPNQAGESALGDVVADAYLAATADAAYGENAAQLAFVNPGGLRSDLTPGPEVTYGQLYSVNPFSNTLVTLELSGAQILRLLEQQWESPQPAGGRVLAVSSGFSYAWDASRAEGAPPGHGQRVVAGSARLNGVAVDAEKAYRVTMNSYLASGGDNFTVFARGRPVQEGDLDREALTDYFKARRLVSPPAAERIKRVD